jgi:group II intron reverse transcriptase/maturase
VDKVTWTDYGQDLEANLQDLHARVQQGRYRAKPSRRVYIPKPDGRQRPLGIASLEDKIVQRAVVEVLDAIYEVDFRGFSYGFRPGRGPHDALDALSAGITSRRVNWVLDADIRDFFGQLDRAWLRKFLEHRIADERLLRLIDKWLAAGVVEDGEWTACDQGSPQGSLCAAAHNAPCGEPATVCDQVPSSITPALNHLLIRRRTRLSAIRCPRNFANHL